MKMYNLINRSKSNLTSNKFYKKVILGLSLLISLNLYSHDNQINEPVKNFEKLWNEYNNYYPFFDIKNTNWEKVYQEFRPLINDETTNDSLFIVCCNMIRRLNDRHNSLLDKKNKKSCKTSYPIRLLEEFPKNSSLQALLKTIDTTLTQNQFGDMTRVKMEIPYLFGDVIEYTNNGKYGYLRVNLMFGLSNKEWNQVIDNVIKSFGNVQGVIIDVRFNSGGYDKYSLQIAGRFVNKKEIGFYKCTKKKSGFTALKKKYLKPTGDKQLIVPIVLLTSNQSMSATDVFALVMKDLPYVTIIGDDTQGIFSEVKEWKLPNGWYYTLSTRKYLGKDMINYEGVGVSPDIKILNTKKDVENGIDPLIIEALKVLKQKTSNK